MNRLTSDQMAFLDRFSRTPDARSLTEILGAELRSVEKDLRSHTGDLLTRAQGDAIRLDWLIEKLSAVRQPAQPAPARRPGPQP